MSGKNLLFFVFISFLVTLNTTDIYVSTKGSDTNTGTTLNQAYKTFKKALSFSQTDLNILVEEGIYADVQITIHNQTNIKISSISGVDKTTLQKYSTSETTTEKNIFDIKLSKYVTISGFSLDGTSTMSSFGSLVKLNKNRF